MREGKISRGGEGGGGKWKIVNKFHAQLAASTSMEDKAILYRYISSQLETVRNLNFFKKIPMCWFKYSLQLHVYFIPTVEKSIFKVFSHKSHYPKHGTLSTWFISSWIKISLDKSNLITSMYETKISFFWTQIVMCRMKKFPQDSFSGQKSCIYNWSRHADPGLLISHS